MSNSTPQKSQSPQIDHVLHTLDFEINRIRSQEKESGWTIWALLGSLATIVWLVLGELKAEGIRWANVLVLILVVCLLIDNVSIFYTMFSQEELPREKGRRYRFSHYLGENRLEIFLGLLRCVALVWIAWYASEFVWPSHALLAYVYYGVAAILLTVGFVWSFLRIPTPVYSSKGVALVTAFFLALFLAVGSWPMVGYFLLVSSDPHGATLAEYRLSFLIATGVLLLLLLTRGARHVSMLASLINVRRALAFGKIDVDTAIQQTDIILTGMRMQDLVQEDLKRLLEYIDQVEEEFAEASKNLDGAEAEIAGLSGQLSPEQEIRVRRTVDSNNQHIEKAEKVREKLVRQLDKFSKRVRRTYILSREGFDAAMEAYSKIGAEGERRRERYHSIRDRTRALAERLKPGPTEGAPLVRTNGVTHKWGQVLNLDIRSILV